MGDPKRPHCWIFCSKTSRYCRSAVVAAAGTDLQQGLPTRPHSGGCGQKAQTPGSGILALHNKGVLTSPACAAAARASQSCLNGQPSTAAATRSCHKVHQSQHLLCGSHPTAGPGSTRSRTRHDSNHRHQTRRRDARYYTPHHPVQRMFSWVSKHQAELALRPPGPPYRPAGQQSVPFWPQPGGTSKQTPSWPVLVRRQ